MLKNGIKNYFKSIKYIFVPLGTMFLFILIALSVLFSGISSATQSLIEETKALSSGFNEEINVFLNNILPSIQSLDWQNPTEAVKTVLSKQWINGVLLNELSSSLGADFESIKIQITEIISNFTSKIIVNVIAFCVFWILGFIVGYILLKVFIRQNIAKTSILKWILSIILNILLITFLVVLCIFLFVVWSPSIYISIFLMLLLSSTFALIEAYLLHGRKKIKLKNILNLKNIGQYLLANVIIFAISILLTIISICINKLMGLFVGLAVIEIAFIVIGISAESYVINITDSNNIE